MKVRRRAPVASVKVSSDHRFCAVVGYAGHLHSGPARPRGRHQRWTAGNPPAEMHYTEGNVSCCTCPPAIHDQTQNGGWRRVDATRDNLADVFRGNDERLLLPFHVEQSVL